MNKKSRDKLLKRLSNPSTDVLEAGSLASGYDLSQEQAGRVWAAMRDRLVVELEQADVAKWKAQENRIWDHAPDWAGWAAQDKDGCWYWFFEQPAPYGNMGQWRLGQYVGVSSGKCVEIPSKVASYVRSEDWTKTLMRRP